MQRKPHIMPSRTALRVMTLVNSFFLVLPILFTSVFSKPLKGAIVPRQDSDINSRTGLPPCGTIVAYALNEWYYFDAAYVYKCLQSTPFNSAVAARFIDYYNTTLQFQATLGTLKAPPPGYQQPAVDVEHDLEVISAKASSGVYANQYEFEADVQTVVGKIHDTHVVLNAGVTSAFSFASPYGLVSVSRDGKEAPKLYISEDVVRSHLQGWTASPISKINDADPIDYLTEYIALNSVGYLEPNAEWNALMDSPAQDIQGLWGNFQSGTLYPGNGYNNSLTYTFENGTTRELTWIGVYNSLENPGPLATGGDFYNFFVLGLYPANYNESAVWWPNLTTSDDGSDGSDGETIYDEICAQGKPSEQNWCTISAAAFPNDPIIAQEDLEVTGGGVVTGYILKDISTGVLSIPTFVQDNENFFTFRNSIQDFINATSGKVSRLIIDLQQNPGGSTFLAYDTFKLFFPNIEPYGASRTRSHPLANAIGEAYSSWWSDSSDDDLDYFIASEWVVEHRDNANTNRRFASWREYYGPVLSSEDAFSQPQRYNLSDEDFDFAAFLEIPWGYDPDTKDETTTQPFAADNIVLLTDGLCSSACSLFVEFMSHQAGVQTIVVGGRPQNGPMQAVSGSRGAASYSADALDYDFEQINATLHDESVFSALPNRSDTGVLTTYAGFTIRNQVHDNDTTPLQFKYQAAECRIFYTIANVYNTTQLWHDAARATWDDSSLCIEGSTGYPTARNQTSNKAPPNGTAQAQNLDFEDIPDTPYDHNSTFELQSGPDEIVRNILDFDLCDPKIESKSGNALCLPMNVTCSGTSKTPELWQMNVLRSSCIVSRTNSNCRGVGVTCQPKTRSERKAQNVAKSNDDDKSKDVYAVRYDGFCATSKGTTELCQKNKRSARYCRPASGQKTWIKC